MCALAMAAEPDQLVGCVLWGRCAEVVDVRLEARPLSARLVVGLVCVVDPRDKAKIACGLTVSGAVAGIGVEQRRTNMNLVASVPGSSCWKKPRTLRYVVVLGMLGD